MRQMLLSSCRSEAVVASAMHCCYMLLMQTVVGFCTMPITM